MVINLQPLFEKQRQLDKYIVKTKGLDGQDLLPNKILALQVELGELANEWRGFKHWSDNKNPVYTAQIDCPVCHGKGFKEAATFAYGCNRCGGTGYLVKHPLLEEYVDCLHFILSIGLELGVPEEYVVEFEGPFDPDEGDPVHQFMKLFSLATVEHPYSHAGDWFPLAEQFIALGEMLGLTWEEIEAAYHAKWEENIRRQQTGY
jgi:dimeric dUTPase (all-alpha-NTP-PPase superfamily)